MPNSRRTLQLREVHKVVLEISWRASLNGCESCSIRLLESEYENVDTCTNTFVLGSVD